MALDHYCTLIDVNALVPQTPYSSSSKPTDVQVSSVIESVATRIDASIGNIGYATPVVTGQKSLALLREACTWGAAGLAQQMRQTALGASLSASDKPIKNIWLQMFDDWLKKLVDPEDPFELPDAPRSGAQLQKSAESLITSSVQTIDDTNWLTPNVTREQVL